MGFVVCSICILVIGSIYVFLFLRPARMNSGHRYPVARRNIRKIEMALYAYIDDWSDRPLPKRHGTRPPVGEVINVLTKTPFRGQQHKAYLSPNWEDDGSLGLDDWGNTIFVEFYTEVRGTPVKVPGFKVWSPGPNGIDEGCFGDDIVGVWTRMWCRWQRPERPETVVGEEPGTSGF